MPLIFCISSINNKHTVTHRHYILKNMPISYFYLNLQINIDISMCHIIFLIYIGKIVKEKNVCTSINP